MEAFIFAVENSGLLFERLSSLQNAVESQIIHMFNELMNFDNM